MLFAELAPASALRGRGKDAGVGVPRKEPPRAATGWDEAGHLSVASLGALVLLGGILQSRDSAGDIRESPDMPGRVPPTLPGPRAGCRSRAEVSPAFG